MPSEGGLKPHQCWIPRSPQLLAPESLLCPGEPRVPLEMIGCERREVENLLQFLGYLIPSIPRFHEQIQHTRTALDTLLPVHRAISLAPW